MMASFKLDELMAQVEDDLARNGIVTQGYRIRQLEVQLREVTGAPKSAQAGMAEQGALKIDRGQPVTRPEAAAFLGVSTKKLQRMEAAGRIARCPGLGTVVRYAARDVLRLASAQRKER